MYKPIAKASLAREHEAAATVSWTVNQALMIEAEKLHHRSKSGLDSKAQKLRASRVWSQVGEDVGGKRPLRLLIKVWLSNGSKYRAAYLWKHPRGALHGTWERAAYEKVVSSAA